MRRPVRLIPIAATAVALTLAACSDQSNTPPEPEPSPTVELYSTPCSPADIRALAKDILPGPLGTLLTIRINLYIRLSATGPGPRAQARLMEIIDQLLTAVNHGLFANNPDKLHKVESLIRLLYCILGLEAPPLDLVNGGAAVVTPTTGATIGARDPANPTANDAATKVSVGDVPDNVPSVVVSVVPLPASPTACTGPLDTRLCQRGPFYEFTTTPKVRFDNPVAVGVCLNKANDASDARVRLAHNLDPASPVTAGNVRFGNIEIITPGESLTELNLSCDPLTVGFLDRAFDWLMPSKLYAGGLGTGGRGGKVSEYSPFGGVVPDLLDFGMSNWLYMQPSASGSPGDATLPSTTQDDVSVPFFAEGGATTPTVGVVAQGPWSYGDAPFGDTQSDGVPFAAQCNGSGGTIDYALSVASLWARASAGVTTDPAQFTYLLARHVFYAANTTDRIRLALDNDIRVWVNGVEVTTYYVDGQATSVESGSFLLKEGCAMTNQVAIAVPRTGVNVISVQARDRGVASYFDATQATPPVVIY